MPTPAPWWRRLAGGANSSGSAASRRVSIAVIGALTFVVVAALSLTSGWRLAESRAFDYLSTTFPPPLPADGPIVVAIDEPSFAEIGLRWPWPRHLHARLVESLRGAGAKAIGLDIVFAEPSEAEADAALAAAVGPDVTLAADETLIRTPQADQLMRVEPLPELLAGGAHAGITSIALDGDGALRRMPAYADGFAATILQSAGASGAELVPGALIQSFGPGRTYPTVSYYQALDPQNFLPPGTLEGRIVLVGLSMQSAPTIDAGGADAYATSWTPRTGRLVAGAEIQATILDNLAHDLFVRPASTTVIGAANVLAVLLAGLLVWKGTGWRTIAATVAALALFGLGSLLLLRFGRVFLPPLSPALAFVGVAAAQGARDYAAERRMRRDIVRAFSQYLSPVLVERLASDPARLRLGGERRTLTILFCDVRGFTSIAESMKDDPERLTSLINRLLNPLSSAVLKAGGTIDKYIGDAIMAFWNAPLDDPDHAVHAVGAALDMIRAIEPLNEELAAEALAAGRPPISFRVGIGVNTGDCVVGNMGSDDRFDYSALGDAVNLASRLESQTKVYDVPLLLGEETARLVGAAFPVIEIDRARVKGKAETVLVSTVIPGMSEAARAAHAALLESAALPGNDAAIDARAEMLGVGIPALAGFYRWLVANRADAASR